MSIYDDLANSGYMNQEELKKQFMQNNYQLDQSMEGTNKFINFNQYEIENSQGVIENLQIDSKFKFGGNANTQNHLNLPQKQQHLNPNYKKIFNPNLMDQNAFDDYQMPSAIKSPLSNLGNQSNLDIQQNLFGKASAIQDDGSDDFLKDSTTGLPYHQPKRVLQLEDEDIIQIHNQHNLLPQEIKTGRFASNHTIDQNYEHHNVQKKSLFQDDINRFKSNNDQLMQVLMQLQTPIQNPLQQNNQNMNQQLQQDHGSDFQDYQRQMSQNNVSDKNAQFNQQPISSKNQGGILQNYDLIKDNSILELAKLKHNSGNGSDNVTPHSAFDNQDYLGNNQNIDYMSRDNSYLQNQQYSNLKNPLEMDKGYLQYNLDNIDFFKIPVLPSNLNTVGNSIISYDKYTPNYPALRNAVPGQSYMIDEKQLQGHSQVLRHGVSDNHLMNYNNKENFDQNNLSQMQVPLPTAIHGKTELQNYHRQPPQKQHSYPIIQTDQSLIQDPFPNTQQIQNHQQQLQMQQNIHSAPQQRLISEQEIKRKEIMSKFDDIPIKDLNKAEGYQEKRMNEDPYDENQDHDDQSLSLIEKIEHSKWKVRMSAYKDINNLFYNEYSKECQKNRGQYQETDPEYDEHGNLLNKPFELYGPMLHKIISDSNLVAQYEGLNCLFAFIKFAPEIKQVVFQVSGILLEKIQHNKPNLKEITLKIILNILKKDKTMSILPEILKRFKNKNFKIATFAVEAVYECMKQNTLNDENSLKQIFKASQDNLSHPNKELKEQTILLIQEIYKNCEDDLSSFMQNLKNLRPVQQKDIRDMLSDVQKHQRNLVLLFKHQSAVPQTHTEGFSPKKHKGAIESKAKVDNYEDTNEQSIGESDLTLLVPDNFFEIPYVTQINVKKKGIEAFNVELEKLIMRRQNGVTILNKDYSQIFNVITHMLEDSNALVFMEAIKTLEYLFILLGKNIKPQKMRQFLALLTDKYKETKTGTIAAVNKALQTIIKKQTLPLPSLFDHLINTLAHNSKNARVKQLILEKCDNTIQEEQFFRQDETSLINIFKSVKEKLLGLIQKDTNASVRDAAVSIIATFKAFTINKSVIDEAINTLPKYRITEINKLAQERSQLQAQQQRNQSPSTIRESNVNPSKKQEKDQHKSPVSQKQQQSQDFFYQGKNISGQYQIHLAEIILSLKKLVSNGNVSITQLQEKWDNAIENLGEQGIQESKSVIVSCVHWLFSQNYHNICDQVQLIEAILGLVKKIYCIDRSVETDAQSGLSQELNKAIQIVLLSLKWISYQKQLENILNVLMSSAANTLQYLESLLSSYEFFSQTSNEQELVAAICFTVKWLQLKIEIIQTKGISLQKLEQFRSTVLSRYLDIIQSDSLRNQLIKQMIDFKTELEASKKNTYYLEEESQSYNTCEDQKQKHDSQKNLQLNDLSHQEVRQKSIGEQFNDIMDQDFQAGLQMIKSFQSNPQVLDFNNKEIIFNRLLAIVAQHTKNPVQKQQQAFTMKALLWMKEEIFGVEDCFQFTTSIMIKYVKAEFENRDSSVELFLLNNWVKQLRLKDLIDRVSVVCQEDPSLLKHIFNWLMMHSLNGNQSEQWNIEDFRKISLLLARNMLEEQVTEFFEMCVSKFGQQKVQDFMEIQLMHNQQDYNSFMNWFTFKFRPQTQETSQKPQINLPQIDQQRIQTAQESRQKRFEDLQLKEALLANQSSYNQADESIVQSTRSKNQSTHSKLYQQLREKRKNSNQRKHQAEDDGLSKYDQIINRLEAQLQQEKQVRQDSNSAQNSNEKERPIEEEKDKNFQFYNSKTSNYYQSDKINRYQIVNTDEDEDLDDSIIQQQKNEDQTNQQSNFHGDQFLEDKQDQLKESTIKQNLWKLEMEKLEQEKQRIEKERYELMRVKNHETQEWKDKYNEIKHQHEDIINDLKEANKCYLTQVSENEELKNQLKQMQQQHKQMMEKFEQFEEKLSQQQEKAILEKYQRQREAEVTVIKQEQLAIVEKVFKDYQLQAQRGDEEIGTKKIQELLLNFSDKEETQRIGISLYVHYQSLKSKDQKFKLLKGLSLALDSEDVLFALPLETYKTILDFNLKVFANEKAIIEKNAIRQSTQSMQRNQNEQNDITMESQKLVSKLLNSKEFTTSLVTLFQILRLSMPEDLSVDLSEEQKHYLRVIMRCISRITKALHSENPDLIRAFDVLIEMQKIFLKNPPESLREDLPCLQDFDYVYRCLKEVSDKLMELQPHKVITFLEFVSNQPENAFIKYMNQVMAPMRKSQQQKNQYQDTYEDYEDEELRYQSNQHQQY